ncbi:MAG: hypothetical protein ACE5KA_04010 [Nitrososphaerales archaeon]
MRNARRLFYSFFTLVIALLLLTPTSLSLNNANAQQVSLSVSAAGIGKFFGPQIVQVVVEGPGIRDSNTSTASLIVHGQNVPLVHLADSRWYAFFADANTFTTLANEAGFPGFDDGSFWVVGPTGKNLLFPTLPTAFGHNATSNDPRNPDLDLNGDCLVAINPEDACVEWPYIKLFNFGENDQVSTRHGTESVTLDFIRPATDDIILALDRNSYPINAEIIFGLSDYMWNINPVEEDRVHFAFTDGSVEVFYQASTELPPAGITGVMQSLGFELKQILSIQEREGIRFINEINGMPETIMLEIFPNAGTFENFDSEADMFASGRNVQFRFDYFDKSISAGMGTHDASVSVGKEIPVVEAEISTDRTSYDAGDEVVIQVAVEPIDVNREVIISIFDPIELYATESKMPDRGGIATFEFALPGDALRGKWRIVAEYMDKEAETSFSVSAIVAEPELASPDEPLPVSIEVSSDKSSYTIGERASIIVMVEPALDDPDRPIITGRIALTGPDGTIYFEDSFIPKDGVAELAFDIIKDYPPGEWLVNATLGDADAMISFFVEEPVIEQTKVSFDIKQKKRLTLLELRYSGEESVFGVKMKVPDGKIKFVKAKNWERERMDQSTVLVYTNNMPVIDNDSLRIILISDNLDSAIEWSILDKNDNRIINGSLEALTSDRGLLKGAVRFTGTPCPSYSTQVPPCDGPYPNYAVFVHYADGETIVARTISDEEGNYMISLEPGRYIIYTQNGPLKDNVKVNEVTIFGGETIKLDLVVDTGIR